MKIPKYILNAIRKASEYNISAEKQERIVDDWMNKVGVNTETEDFLLAVGAWCSATDGFDYGDLVEYIEREPREEEDYVMITPEYMDEMKKQGYDTTYIRSENKNKRYL